MKSLLPSISVALWWLICVFITIDTGQFIYPSLSQTLIGGMCALVLCIMGLMKGFIVPIKSSINDMFILAFCWLLYLCIHPIMIAESETYKQMYLIISLLFAISLSLILHHGLLTFCQLEKGFLLILMIQIVCLLLQFMGIVSSYNPLFSLTGIGDNPNATAILISVCIPSVYDRLKTSNHTYLLLGLLIVSLFFLFMLRCRTAYVGLIVICLIRIACTTRARMVFRRMSMKSLFSLCALLFAIVSLLSVALYRMKQNSSEGRLLVWRVSTEMLGERPEGWGIGMFEHHYNLCQGEYFAEGTSKESERLLASTVYMAYNDLLEHGVEAGWCGAIFMGLFYVALAIKAYRVHKIAAFSIICAFIVMSFVNFIYATIQPWFIFLCYAADVVGHEKCLFHIGNRMGKGILLLLAIFCCFILVKNAELTISQVSLKLYERQARIKQELDVAEIEKLESHIGTSEGYYKFLSSLYMCDEKYQKAVECLDKAIKYTSEPVFYFTLFECYDKMGMPEQGIPYIEKVRNMLPQNMMSRNLLLRWYDSQGMNAEALAVAYEMAEMPLKIKSPTAIKYQQGAQWYIKEQNIKSTYK